MREALAVGGFELPNNADLPFVRHEVDKIPYDADSIIFDLLSPVLFAQIRILDYPWYCIFLHIIWQRRDVG